MTKNEYNIIIEKRSGKKRKNENNCLDWQNPENVE